MYCFNTMLFTPGLEESQPDEQVADLDTLFEVESQPASIGPQVQKWVIEREGLGDAWISQYLQISEYGIPHAVHIKTFESGFRTRPGWDLTSFGVDLYNIVYKLVKEIQPVFGLGDNDERIEPRHIPSDWQYRDGVFEEPYWLTVFGSGYTDRFGTRTLLDAPVWHATEIEDCVLTLLSPSPFKAPDGKDSLREAEREFTAYLEQQTDEGSL